MTKLFRDKLTTKYLGRTLHYFPVTESTNAAAWNLVAEGCENGTVVLADHQLKGRGRRGSEWHSTRDYSLIFSVIYHIDIPPEKLGLLALLSGVSVVDGARVNLSFPLQLKWPNDIVFQGKKVGGILIETRRKNDGFIVVAGIGLNVNERNEDLMGELKHTATSIYIESGKRVRREALLASILFYYEYYLENLHEVIPQWNTACAHYDQVTSFHSGKEVIEGTFHGVTENGYAVIESMGKKRIFSGGGIEI